MADRAAIRTWVRNQTLVLDMDFSDVDVNAILNQGIQEVAARQAWPFLQASTTFQTVADQVPYAMPADFARLEAMYFEDGVVLAETLRRQAVIDHAGSEAAQPFEYYFWEEQFNLAPQPSVGSLTVYVDYQKSPTLFDDDADTPEWDEAFHMVLADYCAARIWEREEDLEKSSFHLNWFIDGVTRMAQFYGNRGLDGPMIVGGERIISRYPWSWQRG